MYKSEIVERRNSQKYITFKLEIWDTWNNEIRHDIDLEVVGPFFFVTTFYEYKEKAPHKWIVALNNQTAVEWPRFQCQKIRQLRNHIATISMN